MTCLNSTVMKDVPNPRECCVLVTFVEELDLLLDDILGLWTGLLVEVHNKTISGTGTDAVAVIFHSGRYGDKYREKKEARTQVTHP